MPTLTTLIADVRLNIRDNATVVGNQAFTDAQITDKINEALRLVQPRYYPRISFRTSAQTGLSFAQGIDHDITDEANYARLIQITIGTTQVLGTGPAFKKVEDFIAMRAGQQTAFSPQANAYPVWWTAWRESSSTSADQGKWTVLIHPASPSVLPYSALVELEPTDLSSGSDTLDIPTLGCTMVTHLASYWLGSNLGVPWAKSFLDVFPELKGMATQRRGEADTDERRGG